MKFSWLAGVNFPVAQVRDSAVFGQRLDACGGIAERDKDHIGSEGRHPLLILGSVRINQPLLMQ